MTENCYYVFASLNINKMKERGQPRKMKLLILIVGEFFAARYRAWLGMVLLPFALFLGLFVVLGGV